MRKNVSGQYVSFQLVSLTGTAVTSGTSTVYYSIDGASQQTGAGTVAHEGNGMWSYAPTQAETNGDHVAWTMANDTPAVSQLVNTYPVSFDYTDSVRIGMTALPNAAADGAGGLPISDAGGLDLDATIGAMVYTEANELDVNIISISGSSTASDNVELVFDTDFATAYSTVNQMWNVTITGTPDVNAIQFAGSTTAANNASVVFDTDFSTNYNTTRDKWQVEADVLSISGDSTAADNLELFFDGTGYAAANSTVGTVTDVTNEVSADVVKISGDATSADNLEESTNGLVPFTVQTGTLSTTQCSTNLSEGTDDHYIGRTVLFLTGSLAGQASDITDYTGVNGILTFSTVTDTPSNGDTGVIV